MSEVRLEALARSHRGPKGVEVAALRELTIAVAAGEWLAIVGPTGSGKTTTLRLIAGLDSPDSGLVRIGGHSMSGVAPAERGVAMVFQDHPLFPHLDVAENLAFELRIRGKPRAEVEARVGEVASRLGLIPLLGRRPGVLSGGERQRVALGSALVQRPKVLLLDEPLAQLDTPTRAELRAVLRLLRSDFNPTVIHVTHDQAEALALADKLAVLRHGRLMQSGPPLDLYRRPANTFVAGFLGSPGMNLLPGRIEITGGAPCFRVDGGGVIELREQWLPSKSADLKLILGLRPESLVPGSQPSALEGLVEAIELVGHEVLAQLKLGGELLRIRCNSDWEGSPGQRLSVGLKPGATHWFDPGTGLRLDGLRV